MINFRLQTFKSFVIVAVELNCNSNIHLNKNSQQNNFYALIKKFISIETKYERCQRYFQIQIQIKYPFEHEFHLRISFISLGIGNCDFQIKIDS